MCPLSLPLLAAKKSLHNRFALKATRVTLTSVAAVAPKKSSATKKRKAIKKKKKTKKKISTGTTTRMTTINSKAKPKSPITKQKKKAAKKKKKQSRKKTAKKDEPIHFYRNETDSITILHHDHDDTKVSDLGLETRESANVSVVGFKVRGNPAPLARHRTYRGFIFNPSAKKQKQFCDVVMDMLPNSYFCQNNITEDADQSCNAQPIAKNIETVIPVFEKQVISIQIISRMKRPNKHFIANRPGPGRLRQATDKQSTAAISTSHLQVTRTDVDNLAKFVLDSLNGVLYEDDKQVASLQVTKVYDDEYPCTGSTDVIIRAMTENHLYSIANLTAIDNSFP